MKKEKTIRAKNKPVMKWQTGDYNRHANFHFILPYPFLLLCRLADTTPEQVLNDFMDTTAGSHSIKGNEKAHQLLIEYFIEKKYGRQQYGEEDIRQQFQDLDAISSLWPADADLQFIEQHARWQDSYYHYWFSKWFEKLMRGF